MNKQPIMNESNTDGDEDPRQHYDYMSEIGYGSCGQVFKAREQYGEQRLVAVKKVTFMADPEGGIPVMMIREVSLLRRLESFDHPNIVKLLAVDAGYEGRTLEIKLVFEYIDQDLAAYINKVPKAVGLGLDKIKELMEQLLRGVDFLHTNNVIHRDLKPQNILVSSQGQVKITDFGLARVLDFHAVLTPEVQTLWYRSPEVLLGAEYHLSVDMWSAGCILAELFTLRPLFQGFSEAQQIQKIFEKTGLPSAEDWPSDSSIPYSPEWGPQLPAAGMLPDLGPDGNDLLQQCLAFKPTDRISALGALVHPFFNESPGSPAPPEGPPGWPAPPQGPPGWPAPLWPAPLWPAPLQEPSGWPAPLWPAPLQEPSGWPAPLWPAPLQGPPGSPATPQGPSGSPALPEGPPGLPAPPQGPPGSPAQGPPGSPAPPQQQCLAFKPTDRISALGALVHPFFNESPGSPAPPEGPPGWPAPPQGPPGWPATPQGPPGWPAPLWPAPLQEPSGWPAPLWPAPLQGPPGWPAPLWPAPLWPAPPQGPPGSPAQGPPGSPAPPQQEPAGSPAPPQEVPQEVEPLGSPPGPPQES